MQKDNLPTAEQLEAIVKRRKYRSDYIRIFKSTVSSLIVVSAIAVLIATLVLPVLRVTGNSMNPTLENGQLVICRRQGTFERGDVIAFYHNNKILLKRVIAVSGDMVNIDSDGNVYVNGEMLEENYVINKAKGECNIEFPYEVPADRYFVMGDNRETSLDSRSDEIGCIAEENVIGTVILRLWPLDEFGRLPR